MLLCSLDPELKEQLVEVIEKLLKDQTTVSMFVNIVLVHGFLFSLSVHCIHEASCV